MAPLEDAFEEVDMYFSYKMCIANRSSFIIKDGNLEV